MVNRIIHILLITISIVIPLSYHPMFFNENGENVGSMKYVTIGLIILMFILSCPKIKHVLHSRFIKIYSSLLLIISIEILTFISLGFNTNLSEIKELCIPLITITIGYICPLSKNTIKAVSYTFIVLMLAVGFEQIRINIGGFVILDQYKSAAKNSIGAMLAIGGVCSLFYAFSEKNKVVKVILFITAFLFFIEILTIRARLATLSYIVVALYIISLKFKLLSPINKLKYVLISVTFLIIIFFVFTEQFENFHDYLLNSFFQNKETDILSGRGNAYKIAFNHLITHPVLGNLVTNADIPWVHNYMLLKLSSFGYIGGLPLIILYLFLIIYVVKGLLTTKDLCESAYGFFLMAILLIVSLGEPTFPYGPGTVSFLPFLIIGFNLSNTNNI